MVKVGMLSTAMLAVSPACTRAAPVGYVGLAVEGLVKLVLVCAGLLRGYTPSGGGCSKGSGSLNASVQLTTSTRIAFQYTLPLVVQCTSSNVGLLCSRPNIYEPLTLQH